MYMLGLVQGSQQHIQDVVKYLSVMSSRASSACLPTALDEESLGLLLHSGAAREVTRRDVLHEPYIVAGAIELPAVAPHGAGVHA